MKKITRNNPTKFGEFIALYGLTHAVVADVLGVTRAYIGMLAAGKANPILHLAYEIQEWSKTIDPKNYVPMSSWCEPETRTVAA